MSDRLAIGIVCYPSMDGSGVPVFADRVGGLPEVVNDAVGRLVEPFDVDALAAAVLDAVTDPGRHAQLSRAARAHALAHFRRAPALDRYEEYYRHLLDHAHREEDR